MTKPATHRSYGVQVKLRKLPPTLTRSERASIAVAARCDVRTLEKLLGGGSVSGNTAEKIFTVLVNRGLVKEKDLPEELGSVEA